MPLPTHRTTQTQNKRTIHALSGIRTHDPSIPAGEDSSCLRPRGNCDRRPKHVMLCNEKRRRSSSVNINISTVAKRRRRVRTRSQVIYNVILSKFFRYKNGVRMWFGFGWFIQHTVTGSWNTVIKLLVPSMRWYLTRWTTISFSSNSCS
jgi:hypothetical protein